MLILGRSPFTGDEMREDTNNAVSSLVARVESKHSDDICQVEVASETDKQQAARAADTPKLQSHTDPNVGYAEQEH